MLTYSTHTGTWQKIKFPTGRLFVSFFFFFLSFWKFFIQPLLINKIEKGVSESPKCPEFLENEKNVMKRRL